MPPPRGGARAQSAVGFDTGNAWPQPWWLAVFILVVPAIAMRRPRRYG